MDAKGDSASAAKGYFSDMGWVEGVVIADTAGLLLLGAWSLSNFRDQRDQIKALNDRVKELEERSTKSEARLASLKKLEAVTRDNVNKIKGHSTRVAQLEQALDNLGNDTVEEVQERRIVVAEKPKKSKKHVTAKASPPRASVSSSGSESDCALSEGENSDEIYK